MSSHDPAPLEDYLDVEERESRPFQGRSVRRLNRYILRHPLPLAGGLLMLCLGTGAALLEPRIFGYAVDEAIVPRDWNRLRQFGVLLFLATLVRVVAVILQGYCFELLGQRVAQDLRVRLFTHLQRLPISVYDRNPAGRLLTRVTNDVAAVSEMFSAGFVTMAGNALLMIGIVTWLLVLNLKLGLIAVSVFPFMVLAAGIFSAKLKVAYREARARLSALNAFLAENLLGIRVVQLFNRQHLHLGRFDRINHWYAEAQMASVRLFAFFQPTITLGAGLTMGLVIWFGGGEALRGSLPLGVLIAYFSYLLSLFQPLREIADKWNIFLSGITSAERIFAVLSWPIERDAATEPPPLVPVKGHVVFEHVWFAYDAEHWVLKDFSLEIQPGAKIGVVGHTGAGKTTLISLLMRFHEPQKGRILLDGRDIRTIDRRSLRSAIGVIQQDAFLFSGSVEDNVTFWGEVPYPSELPESLKARLGTGELYERAANVSMGQRQVLAFARALATRPAIWVLDEATANMDTATEGELHTALNSAAQGKTTIMIAHRLATVRSADRVIVLNKGVAVEQGSHAELVALNGLYARLYRYQRAQELTATPYKPDPAHPQKA